MEERKVITTREAVGKCDSKGSVPTAEWMQGKTKILTGTTGTVELKKKRKLKERTEI
jgi:hypothetical protein